MRGERAKLLGISWLKVKIVIFRQSGIVFPERVTQGSSYFPSELSTKWERGVFQIHTTFPPAHQACRELIGGQVVLWGRFIQPSRHESVHCEKIE